MNMDTDFRPKITVFYCINTFKNGVSLSTRDRVEYRLETVKLPCTGMVKDVFLLRAFESGSDAVVVFACPDSECRYLEGSRRARKRVEWTKKLLDEIGLNGKRLSFFNISSEDVVTGQIIQNVISTVVELGPNPANIV